VRSDDTCIKKFRNTFWREKRKGAPHSHAEYWRNLFYTIQKRETHSLVWRNALDLYSGGARFESRPEHRLSWREFLAILSPSRQILR
jgi:hypothetical protein